MMTLTLRKVISVTKSNANKIWKVKLSCGHVRYMLRKPRVGFEMACKNIPDPQSSNQTQECLKL